jgi:hypothetical protein
MTREIDETEWREALAAAEERGRVAERAAIAADIRGWAGMFHKVSEQHPKVHPEAMLIEQMLLGVVDRCERGAPTSATLVLHVTKDADPELTCLVCHQKECERTVSYRSDSRGGQRTHVVAGLHERCHVYPTVPTSTTGAHAQAANIRHAVLMQAAKRYMQLANDFNMQTERCYAHGGFHCPRCVGIPEGEGPRGGQARSIDSLAASGERFHELKRLLEELPKLLDAVEGSTTHRKVRMMELIQAFDGSTSLQVGAIMPLFADDNVDELIAAMPDNFRPNFVEWCARLRAGGAPLGKWELDFAHGFEAVRGWLIRAAMGGNE